MATGRHLPELIKTIFVTGSLSTTICHHFYYLLGLPVQNTWFRLSTNKFKIDSYCIYGWWWQHWPVSRWDSHRNCEHYPWSLFPGHPRPHDMGTWHCHSDQLWWGWPSQKYVSGFYVNNPHPNTFGNFLLSASICILSIFKTRKITKPHEPSIKLRKIW